MFWKLVFPLTLLRSVRYRKCFLHTRFFISNAFFQLSLSVAQLFHKLNFKCCFPSLLLPRRQLQLCVFIVNFEHISHLVLVFLSEHVIAGWVRCCLIHIEITIIILVHNLCLVYLCPCLGLGQFMPYLCDIFFIFSLIFIVIIYISSLKQTQLFFVLFLEYLLSFLDDSVNEFSNSESSVPGVA